MSSKEPTNAETFYLVKRQVYEKVNYLNQHDDSLENLPKRIAKKIKTVLTFLWSANIHWTLLGYACDKDSEGLGVFNVLEYSSCAVTGKGTQPENFLAFVKILAKIDVPLSTFCIRVRKQILTEIRRQNASNRKKEEKTTNTTV